MTKLDDIVSVEIKISGTVSGLDTLPVIMRAIPWTKEERRKRVRVYKHWTQLALAGWESPRRTRADAIKWLKRRARARRKARRGW